ncbi:ATP-binding protein [Methanoplanus limicola]|uniref:Putative transcriptional regulator n=1 Tax=Methanoplanus limicola DSM 2279 TaxID=937775 RepID=H1Z2Z3_9EURY|nr:ATP-binding protein [Methanoplanus limicola]EHQ34732.1 putative transcriptional regulator [Methanoplanus limicola DSM 2279]
MNLSRLVKELAGLPTETEWVEFKQNNASHEDIGEYISALGNSATYHDKNSAYLIWGVSDDTHGIVGTTFDYRSYKVGNEELENWLRHMLSDNADFEFQKADVDGKNVVLLTIRKAISRPVTFKNNAYIRVGSYKKPLKSYPAMETRLWNRINNSDYELLTAKQNLKKEDVVRCLDYTTYFDLVKMPLPTEIDQIVHYLAEERIVILEDNGLYSITNLGAIMFARKLSYFPGIFRKSIRVIQYRGSSRIEAIREYEESKGYASGFEGLITYISGLLPMGEVIVSGMRRTVSSYPMDAVRELIANALIHQDLSITGAGPMIEIFESRIEITNPGAPLVDVWRIIDNPPRSRNEIMSSLMRRVGFCEERGSGWDKVVSLCEFSQLPVPKIEEYDEFTRVTMYSHIPYNKMTHEERLWACYMHACLKQVSNDYMTNKSLRERFGLSNSKNSAVSRLIKDALANDLIKPFDPDTAPRYMKYVPIWA